jgi:hypothetical protein
MPRKVKLLKEVCSAQSFGEFKPGQGVEISELVA